MASKEYAYFLYPPVWIVGAPTGSPMAPDSKEMEKEALSIKTKYGILCKISRDGMLTFNLDKVIPEDASPKAPVSFDDAVNKVLKVVLLLNVHLISLYKAVSEMQKLGIPKMIISPEDVISIQNGGMGLGQSQSTNLLLARYQPSPQIRGIIITESSVGRSFEIFDEILAKGSQDLLSIIYLIAQSYKYHQDHNFNISLISSWASIEKMLIAVWKNYIKSNRRRSNKSFINQDRETILLNGRDFTANVISEILSIADLLPLEIYDLVSKSRRARNKWVHELKPVTRQQAADSVKASVELLKLSYSVDLESPLYSTVRF